MGDAAKFDHRFIQKAARIGLASLGMGLVLLLANFVLDDLLTTSGWRYPALVVLVGSGAGSYFAISQMIGAFSFGDLRRSLKR